MPSSKLPRKRKLKPKEIQEIEEQEAELSDIKKFSANLSPDLDKLGSDWSESTKQAKKDKVKLLMIYGITNGAEIARQTGIHERMVQKYIKEIREERILSGSYEKLEEVRGTYIDHLNHAKRSLHVLANKCWKILNHSEIEINSKDSKIAQRSYFRFINSARLLKEVIKSIVEVETKQAEAYGLNKETITQNFEFNMNSRGELDDRWTASPEEQLIFQSMEDDIMQFLASGQLFSTKAED